jgi:hypothetical protein
MSTTVGDEATAPSASPDDVSDDPRVGAPEPSGDDGGYGGDDGRPFRPRWGAVLVDWAPVVVGLLPLLGLLVVGLFTVAEHRAPAADIALTEISTRNAVDGHQLLGAYSRYGWNHPGPASFYWFAPFYQLTGREVGALAVASTVMSCIGVGLIVRTVQRTAGRPAAWAVAAAMPLFIWLVGLSHVQSPWNPDVPIVTTGALGVVGAAAIAGRRWALPTAAFLASWAAQPHLGTIPLVVVLCGAIVALTAWSRRHELGRWIVPAVLAAGITVAMWAPVAYEEVTREPGNVTKIKAFYGAEDAVVHPWKQSANAVASAVVGRHARFDDGAALPVERQVGAVALVSVVTAGAATGWLQRRRGEDTEFRAVLCSLGLLGIPVAVLAVHNVRGPIYGYILSFAVGLGFLLWTGAAVTIAGFVTSWTGRQGGGGPGSSRARVVRWTGIGLAAVVALGVTAEVPANGWNRVRENPVGQSQVLHRLNLDNEQVESVVGSALASPLVDPGDRVEVEWMTSGWEIGVGVVNLLEKEGVDVAVPGDPISKGIMGEQLAPDGTETAQVLMIPVGQDGTTPPEIERERPAEKYRVDDGLFYQVYVVPLDR